MAKHDGKHADKGLVNAAKNNHSTLTLTTDFDLEGYDVKGDVTDSSPTQGVWKAKRVSGGNKKTELRLLLTCATEPKKSRETAQQKDDKLDPPTDGTLTITLAKPSSPDETVTQPVVYVTDTPP